VDVKMRKAHNWLWTCRRACGVRWGLRPKVVHCLHVAIIRPSISYVCLASKVALLGPPATRTNSASHTHQLCQPTIDGPDKHMHNIHIFVGCVFRSCQGHQYMEVLQVACSYHVGCVFISRKGHQYMNVVYVFVWSFIGGLADLVGMAC